MKKQAYKMSEKVWVYPGDFANWHFVTLTKSCAVEIKEHFGKHAKGFGSLPVTATIGKTTWDTSVFPDKRLGSYLLPLKAKVRKAEDIEEGDTILFTVKLR